MSCQNDSCVSKNKDTELLQIAQEFTVINNSLTFHFDSVFQDSLVGCVMTTDNCTQYQYWIMVGGIATVHVFC